MRFFFPKTALDAVTNGVEMLDRIEPGWADRIDLDQFDIAGNESCIMGQLFDGYQESKRRIAGLATGYPEWFRMADNADPWNEPTGRRCDELFAQYGLYYGFPFSWTYGQLGEIWRTEIMSRRPAPANSGE